MQKRFDISEKKKKSMQKWEMNPQNTIQIFGR